MKKNDDFLTRLEKDQISRADKNLAYLLKISLMN